MFKKRSRPASVRDKAAAETVSDADQPVASGSGSRSGDEAGDTEGQTVEEMIMLRKLKRAHQGIDLEKLNRGEERRKRREEHQDASQRFGLQATSAKGANKDSQEKKLVRTDNFTQQTNILDVDKHMMAYIENEMAKKRGAATGGADGPAALDPQAELYKLADQYRQLPTMAKLQEEGNMTNSLGMLSAIPEVDLGMENRLRNIEATEKAKRELFEQRRMQDGPRRNREQEANFADARFFKSQRVGSDVYGQMENARRQAAGLDPIDKSQYEQRRPPKPETATDEAVYERFKKRKR